MTVFKPKLRINRRNFVSGAVTLGTSTVLHPFASLAETDQLRILWSGVTFMGRRGREEYLQETFPNIFPLLEIPENRTKLYKVIGKLPGSEDGRVNVNNGEILWVSKRKGAFDAVFLNRENVVTEATMRNIFFIKDNIILTPPLSLGILPGTTRELILNLCQELGYDYREKIIKFTDIKDMSEAFLTSSSYGIIPCYWAGWTNQNIKIKELKKALDIALSKG